MSSLDNLVAEILEQAKKESSRMLIPATATCPWYRADLNPTKPTGSPAINKYKPSAIVISGVSLNIIKSPITKP